MPAPEQRCVLGAIRTACHTEVTRAPCNIRVDIRFVLTAAS